MYIGYWTNHSIYGDIHRYVDISFINLIGLILLQFYFFFLIIRILNSMCMGQRFSETKQIYYQHVAAPSAVPIVTTWYQVNYTTMEPYFPNLIISPNYFHKDLIIVFKDVYRCVCGGVYNNNAGVVKTILACRNKSVAKHDVRFHISIPQSPVPRVLPQYPDPEYCPNTQRVLVTPLRLHSATTCWAAADTARLALRFPVGCSETALPEICTKT